MPKLSRDEISRILEDEGDEIELYKPDVESSPLVDMDDRFFVLEYGDEDLAEIIHDNYERAISKTSDYIGNLYGHVLSGSGIVYKPWEDKLSVLVGYEPENTGVFVISHFSPENPMAGAALIRKALKDEVPMAMAILPDQADILARAGWRFMAKIKQPFGDSVFEKHIMVNRSMDALHLDRLKRYYSESYNPPRNSTIPLVML